jgi:hypothetical protein
MIELFRGDSIEQPKFCHPAEYFLPEEPKLCIHDLVPGYLQAKVAPRAAAARASRKPQPLCAM